MALMFAASKLPAQSLSYSNAVVNLNAAGYWPMHEVETAVQGDIETNYGTLGVLGSGYYPDYQVNSGEFIRHQPGPLANGSDVGLFFNAASPGGGTATNGISVPRSSPLTTLEPPFTVECWYMATNIGTGQGDLFSECDGSKTSGIRVYYQNTQPSDQISVLTYFGSSSGQVNFPTPAVVSNVWHYLVVTCSAATNFTTYLDGVLQNTGSLVGKYNYDGHTPFVVGTGLGYQRAWRGKESEVAVYTNVITDLGTHYSDGTNALSSPSQYYDDVIADNPVLYLRLNAPNYTVPSGPWPTLANYGQTNGVALNSGVYTPGTLPGLLSGKSYPNFPVGLISTNVTFLSGLSSFGDAGYAAAYNPTGGTPFTVSAFFRGNPVDTNRVQSIVGHGTNSWELGLDATNRIVFNSGTNSTTVVATGTAAGDLTSMNIYSDGNWHEVVAVHNGSTNVLYVDGIANNTNVVTANNRGNSFDVMIGSDPCYTNTPVGLGRQFAGEICEVAFFTNALALSQVQSLYNSSGFLPAITQQPVSANVNAGTAFTNTVAGAGSTPLSYQWYTNGVAIGAATNPALILNPVLTGNAGTNYYVVVTNAFGAVTSSVVSLAVYTIVTVNPGSILVTNFQGWGTSLCWWANVVGGYANRTNYVNLAFSTLQLNIARYNIGGGQNPAIYYPSQGYRTLMQGFEPTNGIWNWNADTNQRWVLQQAEARGANFVDAFANSPPWWMCVNSNVDGANPPTNNLQVNCETNFAVYLATVVSNLTVLDGDTFNYLTPMNEPNGSKWDYTNESQEGCDMSPSQQSTVVGILHAQLGAIAPSVQMDAAEDVDPYQTYNDLTSYSSGSLGDVALLTTHTYTFTGASDMTSEAASQKKPLWVSEYGDSDGTGLTMARRIHDDITIMQASAWVYWQFVDSTAGWGFLLNSLLSPTNSNYTTNYTINEKFYVMGQFSEFIRPGCGIVSANDTNTLAAWNPTNSTLVLATVNTTTSTLYLAYNLSDFGSVSWQPVSVYQTASGENLASLSALTVSNEQFIATIPAKSVTTFVLTTNTTMGGVMMDKAIQVSSITPMINPNPTNIVFLVRGSQLTLSWPVDHVGWRLQAQTNSLGVGSSARWFDVDGSDTTNKIVMPINPASGSVFYRLVHPGQ